MSKEQNYEKMIDKEAAKQSLKDMYNAKLAPAMSSAGAYIKAHPWMSAGLATTGASNLAGLFDNSKIGGQALGLLGGYSVGSKVLPMLMQNVSPQAKVLATLGGGALGSLFDSLRQKKEDEMNSRMLALEQGVV